MESAAVSPPYECIAPRLRHSLHSIGRHIRAYFQVAAQPPKIGKAEGIGCQYVVGRALLKAQPILPSLLPYRRSRQHLKGENIIRPQVLASDELERFGDTRFVIGR